VYDQLVSFIRMALRSLLVVALVIAIGAWFMAPTGAGAAARRGVTSGISKVRSGRARAGLRTGEFGEALARYRNPIRVGVIGLAALIYLLRDHPTGAFAITVVIITVLILVLAEILAAPSASESEQVDDKGGGDAEDKAEATTGGGDPPETGSSAT
jgi:hypothetical protein